MADKEVGLIEVREDAKAAMKALVEHFMYSVAGLYGVALDAYEEWEEEQKQNG